jgi:hypothetical protein
MDHPLLPRYCHLLYDRSSGGILGGSSFIKRNLPNQPMNPMPLSRRITSGASRKLLAELSGVSGPSRGAAYGRPLWRRKGRPSGAFLQGDAQDRDVLLELKIRLFFTDFYRCQRR